MSWFTVAVIVPRWEWRTFGTEFADADSRLDGLVAEATEESAEVYLLSTQSDASVKLRNALVDVKRLTRVSDDGLELWMPVMKASFPLSADNANEVLSALAAKIPAVDRAEYTREEFAQELVAPTPSLLAIAVAKRRTHYLVDSCMVESTDLVTDHGPIRTIAIESPDPALVAATIRQLGLDDRPNTNMARGLKHLVGFGTTRDAVIDVGTNSVKFYLAEPIADGPPRTIADRAVVTRLGEGLEESGLLGTEAIRRTVDAVAAMHAEARRERADAIAIVGTAGLRSAANRDAFDEALRTHGLTIEIITGEEERRLAYLAATSATPLRGERLVVFDSGGGSTQFTVGHDEQVDDRFSLDVGSVRIAERHDLADAVSKEQLIRALESIEADLGRLAASSPPEIVIAMGGTVTNLASVKHGLAEYDAHVVEGTVLDLGEIDRQIEHYRTRSAAERRAIVGLQHNRARVILGGACLVRAILTQLGVASFTVTTRGLRHGLFLERFASRQ